jgi:hypothetical protein
LAVALLLREETQDTSLSIRVSQTLFKIQNGEEVMKSYKSQIVMFCLVVLAALFFSNSANATTWNKATKITFSQPVEVAGIVLPSGTYWFELFDSSSNRNIVQIWTADRMNLITTILAIPNYRLTPSGDTVIKFSERPIGTPEAIKAWFYPGDGYGQEFVYPKTRATLIAQNNDEPVLSVRDDQATAPVLAQAPVKEVEPSGEEVEVAQATPAHDPTDSLPMTGSPLPALALVGLLFLGAGLAFRWAAATNAA